MSKTILPEYKLPEGCIVDLDKTTETNIVLKEEVKSYVPYSWFSSEIPQSNKMDFKYPHKETQAEALSAYVELTKLMAIVDENCKDITTDIDVYILLFTSEYIVSKAYKNHLLQFKRLAIAEDFLKKHHALIDTASPLLFNTAYPKENNND